MVAGGLVLLLILALVLAFQVETIRGWIETAKQPPRLSPPHLPPPVPRVEPPPVVAQPLPAPPPKKPAPTPPSAKPLPEVGATPPAPIPAQPDPLAKLKASVARETQAEVVLSAPLVPKVVAPLPPVVLAPQPLEPPIVQPAPAGRNGLPARALPLDPNLLTTERIAAYQVALERIHFSCGFIDGDQGMRTQRMLRAFQASRGLPATGQLDLLTRAAIGEPGEPFYNYAVTAGDVALLMPKLKTWREKSQARRLGYSDIWELLGEKFHCTRAYLKSLNRELLQPTVGSNVIGPKVVPSAPLPKAATLRILLAETSILALDPAGRILAFFPCSIAADKNKRPHGLLSVKVVDPHPDYTFDPALFKEASAAEGLIHKLMIPPGPRNPVGTAWVGLSLPGYGIHGTPDPESVSRTQSHGCFRLANWNADKLVRMVRVGTPVDVQP